MPEKNWQKRAAVEAAGLGISLLATPVGWVIIIGASIAIGIVAAKAGDNLGRGFSAFLYNKSSNVSWF